MDGETSRIVSRTKKGEKGTRTKQDEDKFTVPWRLVEGIASRPMLGLRDGLLIDRKGMHKEKWKRKRWLNANEVT